MFENYSPISAMIGGTMVGLSASLLLYTIGRVTNISQIAFNVVSVKAEDFLWRFVFLVGLVLGAYVVSLMALGPEAIVVPAPDYRVVLAGVLMGIGAKIGAGCTSGYGICGLALVSSRSVYSVVVFLTTAICTVYIVRFFTHGNF